MANYGGVFWSGETLIERLPKLIEPFVSERVDCAAYTLAIGPEVYVSPTDQTADPATVTVRKLDEDEAFTIPPGQFAFLLTEEIVSVPADAIALISIRAKTKVDRFRWRGRRDVRRVCRCKRQRSRDRGPSAYSRVDQ